MEVSTAPRNPCAMNPKGKAGSGLQNPQQQRHHCWSSSRSWHEEPHVQPAVLIPQPDLQQSTNISSVMTISPQQLPCNSKELQEDASVSPFLWMGIALVKPGGKTCLGLYMCPSTLSFAVSGTDHWRAVQQLVGKEGGKASR